MRPPARLRPNTARKGSAAGPGQEGADPICKGTRELIENGMKISADAYDDARRTASQARKAVADLMSDFDVILSPSAPGAPPKGYRHDRSRPSTGSGP